MNNALPPHRHLCDLSRSLPRAQRGAVLLFVVIIFLLILPILIGAFMKHSVQSTETSVTMSNSAVANQAARIELASMAGDLTTALGNGLLETQPSPPQWFINSQTLNVRSDAFWSSCAANNQCQTLSVNQPNGSNGITTVAIQRLVVPSGVTNSNACPADGFVAVYYNIFIHAQTTQAKDGGSMIQSVYRACRHI